MSIFAWLGDASETTASVCVWADTTGAYSVTLDGVTVTTTITVTSGHGVARFDFSGLAADTRYSYTVSLSGSTLYTGTARTMPTAAQGFYVAWFSCLGSSNDSVVLYNLIRNYDIRLAVGVGDLPYCDDTQGSSGASRWGTGVITGVYAAPTDINTWHNQYLNLYRDSPSFSALIQSVPYLAMWDDHESLGDNFDHALTHTNGRFQSLGGQGPSTFANQAAVDASFLLARQARDMWAIGNPSNTHALAQAYKPAAADAATPSSNYPALYFSKQLGAMQLHVLDTISHRTPISQADNGTYIEDVSTAATMLGPYQLKWLKNRLLSSAYDLNPILLSKALYQGASVIDNNNFSDVPTEREAMQRWIARNARGAGFLAGDTHCCYITQNENTFCINSASLGQASQDGTVGVDLGEGYTEGVVWKPTGWPGGGIGVPRCAGLMYHAPNGQYIDYLLVSDMGVELTKWRQYAGSNQIQQLF